MGIGRQAFYKRDRVYRARMEQDQKLMQFVQEIRVRQPCLRTRKLHSMMYEKHDKPELHVGRDRLFEVLREHRQLVRRKRAYHKTTDSYHHFHCHPNLLKPGPQQVAASGPEQVWVADSTYLSTKRDDPVYRSLVTDDFSHGAEDASNTPETGSSLGSRCAVLLSALSKAPCQAWHYVLDDRWLRLLSKRQGRAG